MEPIQPQTTWKRSTSLMMLAIFLFSSLSLLLLLPSSRNFICILSFTGINCYLQQVLLRRETSSRERDPQLARGIVVLTTTTISLKGKGSNFMMINGLSSASRPIFWELKAGDITIDDVVWWDSFFRPYYNDNTWRVPRSSFLLGKATQIGLRRSQTVGFF